MGCGADRRPSGWGGPDTLVNGLVRQPECLHHFASRIEHAAKPPEPDGLEGTVRQRLFQLTGHAAKALAQALVGALAAIHRQGEAAILRERMAELRAQWTRGDGSDRKG